MASSFLHYDIIEKLGEGGMGIVFLAKDTRLNRRVAIKFLPRRVALDPVERARFTNEAQTAAALNHPNIAQVYAIEELDGELFIALEYIEGMELKETIEEGTLTTDGKIHIARQIAEGIKCAHDYGVIHRDIKSRNIMLDREDRVKIMDFGLARVEGTEHITKTGTTVGTTAYMAPEQLAGQEADMRSDIWSFGVVLYELFTGQLPFQGAYEPAVMYAIAQEEPMPLSERSSGIPPHLAQVIHRCLQKKPEDRYQDVGEILQELDEKKNISDVSTASASGKSLKNIGKTGYLYFAVPGLLILLALFFTLPIDQLWNQHNVPEKRYLAVLPIENIGNNPELQAICEGLAEIFSFKLSELEQYEDSYWVAPASEMRRERVQSAIQANKLFGVNLAISSTLQHLQDSTRLILELVDADNVRRLDTEQVVVASQNLADLERAGVQAVLRMLQIEMEPSINNTLIADAQIRPDAYKLYLRGRAALQEYDSPDQLDEAIQLFSEATAIDPQFALAYSGLGESYWKKYEATGDVSLVPHAETALKNGLNINDKLAPVQALLGMLKSGTGNHEQALTHFARALELDPKYSPAYRGMARAFDELGNTEQAAETYQRAIDLKPGYWAGYKDLGVHYLNKGQIPEAIEQLQKVVELTPKNSTAYSNLGVAYYYSGQNEKARQMFESSLALDKNPLTANNLAGIYYWEGKYEQAADMYEIALSAYSDRYEIWGNLAAAYDLSGQQKQARETYHKAIEKAQNQLKINEQDPEVLADLGAYYSDVEDSARALSYIQQALATSSDNLRVRQRAVSTYEKLGMRQEALKWVEASMLADIEMQPELSALVKDPGYLALKETLTANKTTN